jgi:predicted cupin superfamily sugar epimerase
LSATYKSAFSIASGGLPTPFETGRPVGTALLFMVTPEAPVKLHRIRNDQLYHYYQGDPIEVLLLYESGTSELVVVGPNVVGGQLVQLFIPGGTFHNARVTGRRRWFLGGSTEWPGVDVAGDVELSDVEALAAKYPEAAADIRDFPKPTEPPPPPKPEPPPEPMKCPEPEEAAAPEPPPAPEAPPQP